MDLISVRDSIAKTSSTTESNTLTILLFMRYLSVLESTIFYYRSGYVVVLVVILHLFSVNIIYIICHSVHWGINPPFKNTTLLFLAKSPLKSADCPSPPFFGSRLSISVFVNSPPKSRIFQ